MYPIIFIWILAYYILVLLNNRHFIPDNKVITSPFICHKKIFFEIFFWNLYTSLLLNYLYALLIYLLPTFVYFFALRIIKVQHAAIIAYVEPVAVFLWGFLFFSEIPTIMTYIGGFLIILSGYLILRAEAKSVWNPYSLRIITTPS